METAVEQCVVMPNDGRVVSLGDKVRMIIKVSGEQTRGAFSIVEHTVEPSELRPPHVHTKEDAYFYVVEGEIGARIGDQDVVAPAGSYVFHLRDVPFAFWNAGAAPARVLEIIAPAGVEQMMLEMVESLRSGGWPPSPERIQEFGRKYGWRQAAGAEELIARYNLGRPGR